jgi:hypothetical protein
MRLTHVLVAVSILQELLAAVRENAAVDFLDMECGVSLQAGRISCLVFAAFEGAPKKLLSFAALAALTAFRTEVRSVALHVYGEVALCLSGIGAVRTEEGPLA